MKSLIIAMTLVFSLPVFAKEELIGSFTIEKHDYNFYLSYDLAAGQMADGKSVNFFEASKIPETGFEVGAYCSYSVAFYVPYKIVITKATTGERVYLKNGVEVFNFSAGGGLMSEQKCNWVIDGWKSNASGQLRINEHSLIINNKYFRFILSTELTSSLIGSREATVVIEKTSAPKNAQVWLDTMPDQSGAYDRTWFPLGL